MGKVSASDRRPERDRMVDLIARRGIRGSRLLLAMRTVPRERFVSQGLSHLAYEDTALPIENEQTISQPFIVASMIEAADVTAQDRVLEVGTGSGYAAAVLSLMARRVHTIERHDPLTTLARARFQALGYRNIDVRTDDGTTGWPEAAPFDAILVAAAGPEVPEPLKAQLALGGRLVMPVDVGPAGDAQWLVKLVRTTESDYDRKVLGAVSFVPLIGRYGWSEGD